jgi:hypothetical protein
MKTTKPLAAAVLLLTAARAIDAHHSPTMFDTDTAVTIQGTLLRYELANPHSFLYVEFETVAGRVEWAVEGPGPNQLVRRGIALDAFAPGDVIEACGYALKSDAETTGPRYSGKRVLVAEVLVMPDGQARLWSPYGNQHCRDQNKYTITDDAQGGPPR